MKILAHRGYWNSNINSNSPIALREALHRGYGFESDVRDYNGKLVISHYIADSNSQDLAEVLHWLAECQNQLCFAINIKADGLGEMLNELLIQNGIQNYFAFDMSVPQMIEYRALGLTYFTRQSEVEAHPVLYRDAVGVWIDGFFDNIWITEELLNSHLNCGKQICIVSPELHQRDHLKFWSWLKRYHIDWSKIMLCTDYPNEAKKYFGPLISEV